MKGRSKTTGTLEELWAERQQARARFIETINLKLGSSTLAFTHAVALAC